MEAQEQKPNYHINPEQDSSLSQDTPPIHQNRNLSNILNTNEARLPVKDLVDILTRANELKDLEEGIIQTDCKPHLKKPLKGTRDLENTLPISWLYDQAQKLDIVPYVKIVLNNQYLSIEQQEAELQKYRVDDSNEIKRFREKTISDNFIMQIERTLKDHFGTSNIIVKSRPIFWGYVPFQNRKYTFKLLEQKEKKTFFGRRKAKKKLATIENDYCTAYGDPPPCFSINLYDPRFLNICGQTISELETSLKKSRRSYISYVDIERDYFPIP